MMAHKQRSKSTSSIPAELDVEPAQCPLPRLTTGEVVCRKKDLAKWKSHRRSVRCDMVGEREERERAELAAGGSARKPDTPSEMQGGEREAGTPASHKAASFQTPQATGFKLQPRSISLPPQSYAANSPYALAERAVTPAAIPYSTQARISQEASLSSSRSNIAHADQTGTALKGRTSAAADVPIGGAAVADRTGGCLAGPTSTTVAGVTSTALTGRTGTPFPDRAGRFPADPRSGGGAAEGSGVGSTYKAPDPGRPIGRPARGKSPGPSQSLHSMDTKPAAAQVTASLPRSSRRSGSSRLASVVSPRPFGTQSTKISPVSRAWTMDDSYRRFNGETNLSKNSEIADQQHLFLTPEDKAQSQRGSVLRSNEAERGSAPFLSPLVSPQTSCDSSHSKMASAVLSASEASLPQLCAG